MSEDTNPDLQQATASNKLSEKLKANNAVYDQAQGKGSSKAIQEGVQQGIDQANKQVQETSRINNLGKGLTSLYEGVLKIPRFAYSVAAIPQNALADVLDSPSLKATYDDFLANTQGNGFAGTSPLVMLDQLGDYYKGESKSYEEKTQKYDENILGSIGKGKWGQAGSQILDQITESAPSIAGMAMTAGAGNSANLGEVTKTIANALPFMSQKNAQLQDRPDVPEWLKPVNATFNGLAEVVFDQKFGTQAAIQGIVNKFTNEGREAALEGAKELVGSFVNGALKTAKVIKPFATGAIEEGTTQLAQNIVDKYTTDPNKDLMEGVGDAMVVGAAMTGGIESVGHFITPKAKKQITDLHTQQQSLLNELGNPNLSEESRRGVEQLLNDNQSSIESIAKETKDAIAKLNPEQKKQVDVLSEKINVAEQVVNDPNTSEEVKKVAQKQVDDLGKEIDAIKPDDTKEVKGTPITKGTDVAIDDTVELVNGRQGKVTKVEGNQVTMTMENGATFMATPEMVEMTKITPKEALQETISVEPKPSTVEVKQTLREPNNTEVGKPIVEPSKPISDMNSEELYAYAKENKQALKAQDKEFEGKTEQEKIDGGYYDVYDNVQEVGDWATRINYIENSENISDLSKSFKALMRDVRKAASEYEQAAIKAVAIKANELGIPLDQLIKETGVLTGKDFKDGEDAQMMVGNFLKKVLGDTKQVNNEAKQLESNKEVVKEDISQKRNEEVLTKAEDDLKALKQVTNKVQKYTASVKRLNDAYRAGEITEKEFNATKERFDDVIADSTPNMPKAERLTKEETTQLDKELKNENLTTNDFIQHERAKAISDLTNATEAIQQPSNDTRGSRQEDTGSKTEQEKGAKQVIQDKRQAIKDRISQKLKEQRGKLNSGFDASLISDFIELGATYIEEGIVDAKEFIKRFREDYKGLGFDDKSISDEDITNEIFNQVNTKQIQEDIAEIGLTKEEVTNLRSELGQRQFTYEVRTNAERIREAKQLIKEGYNIKDLVKKLESETFLPSAIEVEILKQYYSGLTNEINKNPTPENIKLRDDLLKTIDVVKVSQGRSIQAWDGLTELQDNLANFLTEESRYSVLSVEEIASLTDKYNKAKEALEKYQKKQIEALNKAKNKKAQEEINKQKTNPNRAKVKEAYKEERKKFVEDFRAELRKIRTTQSAVILPYQRELIALAPFVRKMVQSYASEGIYDLKQIVKGIHEEFVQDLPELTEDDVRDIIAGEHRNPRKTRNAKIAQIRDLERQAKLERQIEQLEQGIVEAKNPSVKRAKNNKIAELENEIKQIKKRNPELEYPTKLEAKKKWFNTQIEKIKQEIREGNYEPIEAPVPILLDAEALKLKDEYMEFKEETRLRRDHAEYLASSKMNKALDMLQQVAGIRRLVQTSIDLSIPLRQGISVMMNVGIPFLNEGTTGIGIEAYQKMLNTTFSEKNYNRLMFDIKESPEYLQSKDDGIVYAEIGTTNNENRDEYHRDNFLYRIPYLSAPLRASERAAAAWQNYARYQLYLRGEKALQAEGKTRQNAKEAYEQMAARVMVDTGRGKIPAISDKTSSQEGKFIKSALGNTLYGARLASAIFRKLNPLYFLNPKVDKTVRVQALKDMAGYSAGLLITGLAFVAMGYHVSFDYDDPDFLKARKGKKVIDFTGGQSTYVRTYFRLLTAVFKRVDPDVSYEDSQKYSEFAKKSVFTFFRNKLAPNTSYAVNAYFGENTIGEKFDPWEIMKIMPMYSTDLYKAVDEGSYLDLLTILPVSISGLGYMEYDKDVRRANLNEYLDRTKDKRVVSFLKEHHLNLTSDINQEIYNINDGAKVKMTTEQSDKYEKLWSEYIIDELKDEIVDLNKLPEDKFKKAINKIKLSATKYAKFKVSGVGETATTIREDDKTYQLTPEQVKKRIKLNHEFIKDNGDELRSDLVEQYTEDGMSKVRAERKAELEIERRANKYSRALLLDEEKEKNDGKVTFTEKQ